MNRRRFVTLGTGIDKVHAVVGGFTLPRPMPSTGTRVVFGA